MLLYLHNGSPGVVVCVPSLRAHGMCVHDGYIIGSILQPKQARIVSLTYSDKDFRRAHMTINSERTGFVVSGRWENRETPNINHRGEIADGRANRYRVPNKTPCESNE